MWPTCLIENNDISSDCWFCSYSPPMSPLSLWEDVLGQPFHWRLEKTWNNPLQSLELWQNYLHHFPSGWCAGVSTHHVFDGQLTAIAKQTLQIGCLWCSVIGNHQFLTSNIGPACSLPRVLGMWWLGVIRYWNCNNQIWCVHMHFR